MQKSLKIVIFYFSKRMRIDNSTRKGWSLMDRRTDQEVKTRDVDKIPAFCSR